MVAINMEMPRWCSTCPMCIEETIEDTTTTYCSILNQDITWNGNRDDNCPLVEIITCKECEHWDKRHYRGNTCYCEMRMIYTEPNEFCNEAMRKVEDEAD